MDNKLLEFQKRVGAIKKDSQNPHFKNRYFDINTLIDTIKPILNELELTIHQPLGVKDGRNLLATILKDGEVVIAKSEILLPDLQDPQKVGSALTYYRRYSLQSLLFLEAEDDDSNSASGITVNQPKQINNLNQPTSRL
jgi:hypothetical protein